MTTPACLLAKLVGCGPIIVQRIDRSEYSEPNHQIIQALIATGSVEGVGPRSGAIRFLRMLTDEDTAFLAVTARLRESASETSSFSVNSTASREAFEQKLGDGLSCWTHKTNAGLNKKKFRRGRFNPDNIRIPLYRSKAEYDAPLKKGV